MKDKKPKNNDSIPTIVRQEDENEYKKKGKKGNFKAFRPIIIASVLAIATGSILGVIMINMFTTIEDNTGAAKGEIAASKVDDKDNEKQLANSETTNSQSVSLDAWNAYVLQGGVFSDQANAEELASQFNDSGFPSVVWERDNQYFVLLGIAETEDVAKSIADEIGNAGHDVFVKSWQTADKSIDLTDKEQEWIKSFEEEWKNTLQTVHESEGFPKQNWEKLLTDVPEADQTLNSLSEKLQTAIDEQQESNKLNQQQLLLKIWLLYEEELI